MQLIALYTMAAFYFVAGLNHFLNARFYMPLIPAYLSNWRNLINIVSGIAEMLLAIGLLFEATRLWSVYAIILMLIAFIPAHVWMIQQGNFKLGKIKITPLIAWVRLLVIHPLLILWAWWVR
ncbi:MAG: hypothetical protein K2Y12_07020 [Chitinophagaceae bacterium]|jgi:uncharacterized membrane protein|nr:hypothetical protein [Chitinophagaceae bacterium]